MTRERDDSPARFRRNWLAYDEARPTRPRLARRFVIAIAACLLASALLMLWRGS